MLYKNNMNSINVFMDQIELFVDKIFISNMVFMNLFHNYIDQSNYLSYVKTDYIDNNNCLYL